ncbi:hypothetical protein [Intestinimonas butyriciproducens]|uniref:hypothetical protein n=1 Tax=Intestinimonas butyriciproducens TaxID=1297617 RepID=UPI00195B33E0|nr:hypothetical protein [Intestinimonas butyriciproducens]MBM6977010.1 hypothetical protein [Intestinimonas butyriciproducens]
MARYQIVLVDQDEDYLSLLELRFLEHFGDVADIQLISDPAYFHTFFETPRKMDLLIINQELYIPELEKHSIGAVIRLSETPTELRRDGKGCVLYKYTGMKVLFDELSPYLNRAEERAARKQEPQLVCVYAPSGGAGATTLSLGICAALASRDRRVLYLNTETIQSFPGRLPQTPEVLSAACRDQILRGSGGAERLGREAFGSCGFDYLLPFEHSITTYGITLEHLTRLAEELRRSGRYQCVVVDCSSEFTQEKSALMSLCSTVLLTMGQDRLSCDRMESLLGNINIRDTDKFLFACNRYREDEENCLRDTLLGRVHIAEYIPYLSQRTLACLEELGNNEAISRLAYRLI